MLAAQTPKHTTSPLGARRRRQARAVSLAAAAHLFMLVACMGIGNAAADAAADPVKPFQDAIAAFRKQFWINGLQGPSPYAPLAPIESELRALADRSTGSLRARALLELGRTQRMGTAFAAAIVTLTEAAGVASSAMVPEVAFDAWQNIARAHVIGSRDYGAASDAIDRAERIVGEHPSQQQQFDLADIRAILYEARGEAEAALIEAVAATRLARTPENRYFGSRDVADALTKIFYRCQQTALTDAQSQNDSDARWGACGRTMSATRAAYGRAGAIADEQGWSFLAQQARQEGGSLEFLYTLWKSNDERIQAKLSSQGMFHPKTASQVLATQLWWNATVADLPQAKELGPAINETLAQARLLGNRPDARSLALQAARPGTDPKESARLLAQASDILQSQRHSFFDARSRGTVIEDSSDIPLTLAMEYLSLHREAEAFDAFESMRARGLGELNQTLGQSDSTDATRKWLASVLALDARASRIETGLVEQVGATGNPALVYGESEELQAIRQQRERLIAQGVNEMARLRSAGYQPAHLADLETAAREAGVSVMLYWSDAVRLVAWYVGPHGSEVRNVFLPQSVLQDDVRRIRNSASGDPSSLGGPFDDVTARELYLFLIAPFERLLDGGQIMIVPEGPLVNLPFETLLMPGSDKPLIERWAVSYAPNATLALRALRQPVRPLSRIDAVFDPDIDNRTHESAGLRAVLGARLHEIPFDSMLSLTPAETAGGAAIHLLLHGRFDEIEPLMSDMSNEAHTRSITAAEFMGLPLRGVPMAVLSACETGQVGVRLSNEIYGFPWALLAGGVDAAVVSRWQVLGTSNEAWMRLFYSAAMAGQSPAQAGAAAMRGLRAAGQTHPFYWAAMQVTGR